MPVTADVSKQIAGQARGLLPPACYALAITKSDTDELATASDALFIGTGGDIAVIMSGDAAASTPVVLKNIPDGTLLPLSIRQLMSTNTTASNIVSLRNH